MLKIFRNLRDLAQSPNIESIDRIIIRNITVNSITFTKHHDPKFKWHRRKKYIDVELPDYHEKLSKEKWRTKMKELGLMPPRFWKDRPVTVTSTNQIIEPYEVPEADGRASIIKKEGIRTVVETVKSKRKDYKAHKEIKSYDPNFDIKSFPQEAHDIYVKAHNLLMKKDPEELSNYVTEQAVMQMLEGTKLQTIRWRFIESLEPPKIVQMRTAPAVVETNIFGQITVRFHTKQCLSIYDRFGRLFYGSEIVPKDVLEFVVFEKHIVNEYGLWRMHGKIIPDWIPSTEPTRKTYRVQSVEEDDDDEFMEVDTRVTDSMVEIIDDDKNESENASTPKTRKAN